MEAARRQELEEIEAENLADAQNPSKNEHRRGGSAVFAGSAAQLLGKPVTDNPFTRGSRLFERWETGWFTSARHGDPEDNAPAPWRPASQRRSSRVKPPRIGATYAFHTHPEDD